MSVPPKISVSQMLHESRVSTAKEPKLNSSLQICWVDEHLPGTANPTTKMCSHQSGG